MRLGCGVALFVLLGASGGAIAQPSPAPPAVSPGTALDAANGFGPYHFGDTPRNLPGPPARMGQIATYPAPDASLGRARVGVSLLFTREQLIAICLSTRNEADSRDALAALEAAYGPGYRPSPAREELLWHGRRVWLKYVRTPGSNSASIWWMTVGGLSAVSVAPSARP